MMRLAAGFESLDDEHAASAAWARACERLCWIGLLGRILLGRRWGEVQELPHGVDRFGTIAAGEQAVMADAVEAPGQDVDEEAADELISYLRYTGRGRGRQRPNPSKSLCRGTSSCRYGGNSTSSDPRCPIINLNPPQGRRWAAADPL
jgi:hypothetical protein